MTRYYQYDLNYQATNVTIFIGNVIANIKATLLQLDYPKAAHRNERYVTQSLL